MNANKIANAKHATKSESDLRDRAAKRAEARWDLRQENYDAEKTVVMPRAELDALIAASRANA